MELKVSTEKSGFSSSDVASDTEEKEVSEGEGEDDDDRNHKHRRREAHSQSLEGDSFDQSLTRPCRKRNRPFENGYYHREGDPQSSETWKNFNNASDREFSSRVDKRRLNQASVSKTPLELNQRIRGNQMLSSEVGIARGREREPISWGIHDSRFGLVDAAPQIVQPGPVPSAMFAGRGLSNISSAHSASWNAFGLVPGIPNGGLDSFHPLGLRGALRPAICPPVNIGIPRPRCRDFEERGFCLRGDMCPMEHGVHRIVIEDVQGLSQFNLPVSVPGSQLLGTSCGQGVLPLNNKAFHAKSSKPGMAEDGFGLDSSVLGGSVAGAPDVYDPDQPLWTNDDPKTSAAPLALHQSNANGTESFLGMDLSDRQNIESVEGFNDDRPLRNVSSAGPQCSSVRGRIDSSKCNLGVKGKIESAGTCSSHLEQDNKNEKALSTGHPDVPSQGKLANVDENGPVKESSLKRHSDSVRDIRKPAQKALHTLFVNGIPLKDNKREALLSHFQKFGEVIDIYIPMKTERAFVQFSRREEAEAALRSPDAVMGNRFIKLWWANRDNIPVDRISGNSILPITPRGMTINPAIPHPFVLGKGKEIPHSASDKDVNSHASVSQPPNLEHAKPMVPNGPKAPSQQLKKLESLELLKEELRKKQEMLDRKRNEFRRQLDKLEKQAVGGKEVTASGSATKSLKIETSPKHAKDETKSSPREIIMTENTGSTEHALPSSSKSYVPQEPLRLFRQPAPLGAPFASNRFKLDNRPTTFRIASPLHPGLANAAALEEHFSAYGDLSSVSLEGLELQETNDSSISSALSARVSFTTRRSAEQAFLHGQTWQGHKLQFMWLISKETRGSENHSPASKAPLNTNVEPIGDGPSIDNQKIAVLGASEKPENLRIDTDANTAEQDSNGDSKSMSTSSSSENKL